MLAAANKDGVVEAAVPGLAHMARLTVPETEAALGVLSSPDPYSRTPAFEGRRIEKTEGGWQILNHDKYREQMSAAERKEYNRLKQQETRARRRARGEKVNSVSSGVKDVNDMSASQRQAEAKEDSNAEENPSSRRNYVPPGPDSGKSHSVHYQITQSITKVFADVTGHELAFDTRFTKALEKFLAGWNGTADEWLSHYRDVLCYGQSKFSTKELRSCANPILLCRKWPESLAEVCKLKADEENDMFRDEKPIFAKKL